MSFKPMRIQQPPKCTQHQPVLLKTTQNRKNRPFWSLLTGLMMPEHSQSYLHSTSIPHATSLAYVPILHILFRHCNADVAIQKSDSMLNATVTASVSRSSPVWFFSLFWTRLGPDRSSEISFWEKTEPDWEKPVYIDPVLDL